MLAPRKKYLGASWLLAFLPNFEPCLICPELLHSYHNCNVDSFFATDEQFQYGMNVDFNRLTNAHFRQQVKMGASLSRTFHTSNIVIVAVILIIIVIYRGRCLIDSLRIISFNKGWIHKRDRCYNCGGVLQYPLPIGSCILFRQQTHVPTGYYQRADRRQF